MTEEFSIGTLSERSGVNVETIRYYEKIGVMPIPARSSGGYRIYDLDQLRRLHFVRRGRELGFSLDELRYHFGLGNVLLGLLLQKAIGLDFRQGRHRQLVIESGLFVVGHERGGLVRP